MPILFPLDIYLKIVLLGHMLVLFLIVGEQYAYYRSTRRSEKEIGRKTLKEIIAENFSNLGSDICTPRFTSSYGFNP